MEATAVKKTEHIDPVCGMTVDPARAAGLSERDGVRYYFYSAGGKAKFAARAGVVYLTGVPEVLGAAGVWTPSLTRLTGLCLIVMPLALLPANIYSAINRVDSGGRGGGPA